jgi:hypothetical protein
VIATTRLKIGISTEIGCRNCHGGPWRQQGRTGLSRQTASAILATHDKRSKTQLGQGFVRGRIVVCRDCHADSSHGAEGLPGLLNLSASMHGFHAAFLYKDNNSCAFCHAGNALGATGKLEDLHTSLGIECVNCHGSLVDHAMGLLKQEQQAQKPGSGKLLALLADKGEVAQSAIKGRKPWDMEPGCLTCHKGFQPPDANTAFNTWNDDKRDLFAHQHSADGVLLCASCHGAQHSLYPADNAYRKEAGNLQPQQYQNNPYPIGADRGCAVCHTVAMEEELHHPGSLGTFRNRVE